MGRPYIICHMMTSLDGKIAGPYLYSEHVKSVIDEYDRLHEAFHARAWMCGRKTMEENFTMGKPPKLEPVAQAIPRTDYLAKKDAGVYCISVDPSGKLGWPANYIESYNGRSEAHIVEILTESVSDEYLGFLRKMEISYLFGGSDKLDLNLVAEKIREVLGVELLLVEGGGALNGSFMEAGLIDEMSLLLAPAADGSTKTPTLFETGPYLAQNDTNTTEFLLKNVERIGENGLRIQYMVKLVKT